MTESVDILIRADDQASSKFAAVSDNMSKSMRQAEGILRSLETPTDKYNRQLEELAKLHAAGAITAEQFADAEGKVSAKLQDMADKEVAKKLAEDTRALEEEQRKFAESAAAAESILQSLEDPAERYARKLEELRDLHEEGVISAEEFAEAEGKIAAALEAVNEVPTKTGQNTKAMLQLGQTLASLTGNSDVAGFAGQMANATDKVGKFADVSKAGGAGATALKLGLIGIVAGVAFSFGKVLADWIWNTKEFERSMRDAKEEAAALEQQIKEFAQTRMSNAKEDIELIRDPEAKREAYKKLLSDLEKDIDSVGARAAKSKREADEWADAWQITGNRKQYAEDAATQARIDKEQVETLKRQAGEIRKIIGVRAEQVALLKAENAAKDKSESYITGLKEELEYLQATRDEQIKIEAARNATKSDRGEAERLLKERDAIEAKIAAEKELAETQRRAREDEARAAQQAIDDAERETQRLKDLEQSIQERIELRRIELTQGKEAARVQELINQGIDAATAKKLAAQEAELDKFGKVVGKGLLGSESLTATESRLLTRGPASNVQEQMLGTLNRIHDVESKRLYQEELAKGDLEDINVNTKNNVQVVMIP